MSIDEWTEEEQRLLEEGLVQAAVICDLREKWLTIANTVGTRDARACAERFRFCREQALLHQANEGSGSTDEGGEDEAEDEDEEIDCDDPSKVDGEDASGAKWSKEDTSWEGRSWKQSYQSENGCGKWWEGNRWKRDDWKWHESRNWQGHDQWYEAHEQGLQGESALQAAGSTADKQDPAVDEKQQRALLMRQEVEANRERLRLKQEREEEARKRKEKKLAEEQEERDKQRRDRIEEQNRKIQEQLEQQRLRAEREEREEKAARAKAQQFNPGLSHARMMGGKAVQPKKADWAAKSAAGQRGLVKRREREEALEKQAAEVLANIAASKSKGSRSVAQENTRSEEEEEEDDESIEHVPNVPCASSSSGAAQPAAAPTKPPLSKAAGASPKAAAPAKASSEGTAQKARKRWWHKLDGDCPISLAPLGELPQPPFGLQAEGSCNLHYFDARFLASFLLSSCDFIDPVNRRQLTLEECTALDEHLQRYYPGASCDSSVADAFTLFERQRASNAAEDGSAMHSVQREATAVLQHLFRFGSARRTDRRGRAIAYADGGLTVVDDDDILASGGGGGPASSAPAEPSFHQTTTMDFPTLADETSASSSTCDGRWARHQSQRGNGAASSPGAEAFPSLSSKAPAPKAWGPKAAIAAKAKAAGTGRGGKGRGGRGRR